MNADLSIAPAARRGLRPRTIRVLLVDDRAIVRESLRLLLRPAPDILVVGEAESAAAAAALVPGAHPDVLLLVLEAVRATALRELRAAAPTVPVLMAGMFGHHDERARMLEAGARGYLGKEAAPRDLLEGLRVVAGGDVYGRVSQFPAMSPWTRFSSLSEREQAILRLTAEGSSGAEIARQLGISTKTVDTYKHRIDAKLGLAHRRDYVRFAVEAGILRY
jgi:DNA-binding NarL/FixJ family response regulator